MEYLPLFVNLKKKSVLVVGGGSVACRKIQMLEKTGAIIKIIAKILCPELKEKLFNNRVIWLGKTFQSFMLDNIFLVIVATNDIHLNHVIFQQAEKRYILINTVDDQSKCSFIFPAIIDRSPVIVGISSCGTAPVLTRILREKLESLLPMSIGVVARLAGIWRNQVKQYIKDIICRRRFWEKLFYDGYFTLLVDKGNFKKADQVLQNSIYSNHFNQKKRGCVSLVGAGPGDKGLLTIRGLQIIQQADIILYDHLVNADILDLARRDAEKICVGKYFGKYSISQEELNSLIVRLALNGNNVVRLKGGDSFIFGRGGEELQAISEAGIEFQVVPGITAGIGVAAYAGIPLTHRKYAHSVTFVTGHRSCDNKNNKINWNMLSDNNQTVVIYMSKHNATNISKNLIYHGRRINTPIAVISRGTYQDQKILIGTLAELDKLAFIADKPMLLIIGDVVLLHNIINWFGNN